MKHLLLGFALTIALPLTRQYRVRGTLEGKTIDSTGNETPALETDGWAVEDHSHSSLSRLSTDQSRGLTNF
jgi:hypothetical protein